MVRLVEPARGYGAIHVFERLRDEILSLELRPGQLIDEASLAARFDVSRSPVREALVRLAAEGLVETVPNKGTIVTPLNIEEFPQYIDALDLIQRAVNRLAARHRTEADLAVIRQASREFSQPRGRQRCARDDRAERRFPSRDRSGGPQPHPHRHLPPHPHARAAARCGSTTAPMATPCPPSSATAHDAQIEAIAAQDEDLAERLGHEHAEEVHQRFIHFLSASGTRGTSRSTTR